MAQIQIQFVKSNEVLPGVELEVGIDVAWELVPDCVDSEVLAGWVWDVAGDSDWDEEVNGEVDGLNDWDGEVDGEVVEGTDCEEEADVEVLGATDWDGEVDGEVLEANGWDGDVDGEVLVGVGLGSDIVGSVNIRWVVPWSMVLAPCWTIERLRYFNKSNKTYFLNSKIIQVFQLKSWFII